MYQNAICNISIYAEFEIDGKYFQLHLDFVSNKYLLQHCVNFRRQFEIKLDVKMNQTQRKHEQAISASQIS